MSSAELLLFCILDAGGHNNNKDGVYDLCTIKCKFCIIMKALKKQN